MEYLVSALWSGLELTFCCLFSSAFLPRKEKSKKRLAGALLIWSFTFLYIHLDINQYVKLLLTLLANTALSVLLLQGTLAVHLCLAVSCNIFLASLDTLAAQGMCWLLGISYNTFVWRKLSYTTLITAEKLLAVFLAWVLRRFRKKGALGEQGGKWVLLSSLFPGVSVAMLAVLFYTAPRDGDVAPGVVIFAGVLMVANVAMLYVISSMEKAMAQEQDLRLLRQQIAIQTENYEALKKSYSLQRKSTHEFQRHIQVLKDLVEQGEADSAREYLRQLQADRTLKVFSISSRNPVIDVVLNQKHQLAQEQGINMQVKVNDLSTVEIPTNQLVVLLSNLLDNAIDACGKVVGSREILCSLVKEESLFLSIRNTSAPVTITDGSIATTKPDATQHGYGLPAVKYILNQLGAEYTFAYQDGWFQFAAELPM